MPYEEKMYKSLCDYLTTHSLAKPENTDLAIGQWLMSSVNRKHFWRWQDRKNKLLKSYKYMITFTLKPDAEDDHEKAEFYIKEQVNRDALGILQYYYVKELTKAGVPHWHVAMSTTKPFKRNRLQYYEKKFGSVDVSRTKGQTIQEALNYMSKEGQPKCLKD